MAIHYRTQGIILKKEDLREADRVFTFFTRDFGKLELLARGERKIKSKLRAGLELFYLTDIEFIQGKTYKTLTDTSLIDNFKNIRKNLERLKIANLIAEILNDFLKGEEKDENLWELLNDIFLKLNNLVSKNLLSLLYYYFFWNFFSILGYEPQLYNCTLCQKKIKPETLYFSPEEGGIICPHCFKKEKKIKKIDLNIVKILRLILKKDWNTLKRIKIERPFKKELKDVSENYLSLIKSSF
ncbi:DNA repair protein RecO [Patescibacteria group bacterium]|nr:DNA repair protein RecO [Patescibacteria group bacterium]